MKIFITLDYELFLGSRTGTLKKCCLDPAESILNVAGKRGVKLTLFVDSAYLSRLREVSCKDRRLRDEYSDLTRNLREFAKNGHDIQLHVHPHWEDCRNDGSGWMVDTRRFRLQSFDTEQIDEMVGRYKKDLEEVAGNEIIAYRAGGYCIQPFEKIGRALATRGIFVDSSVFCNGVDISGTHAYDFRGAPKKTCWRFESDPLTETGSGSFLEVPISSQRLMFFFYWKLLFNKVIRSKRCESFGDGISIKPSRKTVVKSLISQNYSTVSIDGYKASLLKRAFTRHAGLHKGEDDCFVIIGHPKAMSEFSLSKLEEFIEEQEGKHEFTSFSRQFRREEFLQNENMVRC